MLHFSLQDPIFIVIVFTFIALMGGGVAGILHPRVMLYLITYVGISIGVIMFLTLIDALTPR